MTSTPLRDALHISYAAVGWCAISAGVSIAAGIAASSTALVGTGADVGADMASSVVLIWRFRAELGGHPATVKFEHRAERVAAAALILVAIGIFSTAVSRLVAGQGATRSALAITASVASVVVLPLFAVGKYRIARRINSAALRMDGHISLVGTTMPAITLVGLVLTSAFGLRWADPAAAIAVAIAALAIGLDTLLLSRRR